MLSPERHTLPKAERLSGKTTISTLMRSGRYVAVPPLRCCFRKREDGEPCRIAVSVPKRLFKRAVKRNLVKRRLRESFRLQKESLPAGFDLMLIYGSPEILPFSEIYAAVGMILANVAGNGKV